MRPLTIAAIAGLSLLLLSGKSSFAATGIPKKYIPKKQSPFKNELDVILNDLEDKLNIVYLHDFFMCVAEIESKFIPSAIRYENISNETYGNFLKVLSNNPYINQRYLWEFTGGLFQMFPSTALKTADDKGDNLNPLLVFHPLYTIAFAVDYAYRLNKIHDAYRWIDIRLGWASLSTLKKGTLEKQLAVQNRMMNAADTLGINPQFLYQHPNFNTYSSKYQFAGLVKYLFDRYGVK